MIVDERQVRPHEFRDDGCLLGGLPYSGSYRGFVAGPGPSGHSPGVAVVTPGGAMLEQYAQVVVGQQQSCCAIATPMPVATRTFDPSIAIGAMHMWGNGHRSSLARLGTCQGDGVNGTKGGMRSIQ